MNTEEIKKYLESHDDTRDIFLNVYAVDQLPKKKISRTRWLLVTNCCPANRRGEHWVAMHCENDNLEFFDSFGMPPSMYNGVPEFIKRQRTKSVIYNCQQVQSIDSDACGHYCIMYAIWRAQGYSLQSIMTRFRQINDRDSIVKYMVTNLLI